MPHFYEELKSHSSVMKRPEIRGVQKNFYFISHSFPEQGESDSNSKRNNFEADYLVHLCKYLLQQDYSAEQITILTPYLGQVSTLRRKIFALSDKELSQVRVTAVDNFQGEENEIILLSLVRSNGMGKIGFLKIPNRCCVALSRAKSGFFCIGDFQHLRTVSPLWEKICASMEAQNAIGPSLSITCGIHGTVKEIGSPELFGHFAPEGGCERSCGAVLACGHTCIKKCHTSDSQHRKYKCEIPVEKEWPDCGHKAIVSCHMSMSHSSCPEICKATLNCGHICTGNCGECRRGRIHIICRQKCHRPLVCGHYCQAECGRPCPPCQLFCENGCAHRSCSQSSVFNGVKQTITGNTCSEPCAYCQADCSTSCLHTRCLKKCHEICDPTAICSANCGKRLPCGHSCAGLCGLPCPSICLICDDPILPKLRWKPDVLMYHSLEDLLKSPLIQLEDCGHFAPVKVFDTFLDVNKYFGPVQRVRCPREGCNVPVRRSSRYKRSVQTVSNVVEQIKVITP